MLRSFINETLLPHEVKYAVNLEKCVKEYQMKQVERIFENRYGVIHTRIFRILKMHRSLDEKQISEAALLSLKETRSILMELFTVSMIQQEVPF